MYRLILIFNMYTLRTIETDGREVNLYLGTHYTITKKENVEPEHFNHKLETFFGKLTLPDYIQKSEVTITDKGEIHLNELMKVSNEVSLQVLSNLERRSNEHIERGLVKAFIDAEKLPNALPIYINKQHYIVGESGRTLQKL